MTFDARENSLADGQPIRLYEFQRGLHRWRYTTADRDVEFQTQTFESIAIMDDGIRRTGEAKADTLKVTVPWNNPVARLFRGAPPSTDVEVIIRDTHFGESDFRVSWTGSIASVKFPSPERAEIICQEFGASLERPGLWLGWERNCPYSVFDLDCGLSPALFAVPALIQSLDAVSISSGTFDAQEDGYFSGGYVEWDIGLGEFERRTVLLHTGSELMLLGGTDGLEAGQGVTAYPGCPRTIEICQSRFGNNLRYGGHKDLPGKSPFDGDPVFW